MSERDAALGFVLLALMPVSTTARAVATPSSAIYVIRANGSGRHLVGGTGANALALSKDGTRLAFLRGAVGPQSLWTIRRNGFGERQLVSDTADEIISEFPLAWAPAGNALAYTAIDHSTCGTAAFCNDTQAVIVDAGDGHRLETIGGAEALRWTPDGRRMVWACDTDPDPYGEKKAICFRAARGGVVARVRVGPAHRPLPAPSGTEVAFTGYGGGSLRVLDTGRRSVRRLIDPTSSIDGPLTWAPDGRRIAFGNAAGQVFSIPSTRGRPRRLGRFHDASGPVWSPRGNWIAFGRNRLWLVRPDGSDALRVTRQGFGGNCPLDSFTAASCGPEWSPDGRSLYYLGLTGG